MKEKTRRIEESRARLFSIRKPFSEHLVKWEDSLLPDKYDHNCFEYCGQPTRKELEKAIAYQKQIGAAFLKLEGDEPLSDSFGLEAEVTLTMVLKTDGKSWTLNPDLCFRTPSVEEVEELEVKHCGRLYGEDFSRRNILRLYGKLAFHGAYLDGKLAGACHVFCRDGFACMDGLLVDEAYRKRYIATSLIAHVKNSYPDAVLFLHADEDDTPRRMYEKMRFETVDKLYEYTCLDLGRLSV